MSKSPFQQRQILVTSALPYANGAIHLGHLVEYIQTDIWVRYQKLRGHNCLYVCADDAHGTPIMLKAQEMGISPEDLINKASLEHQADFKDFHISFDNYYSTHSAENRQFAEQIYLSLREKGHIDSKVIEQAYDPEKNMFLPDRFIKGECPKCGAADQYGDNCEACGATYDSTDLINPVSAVSGATPERRESEHLFVNLSHYEDFLKQWLAQDGTVQPEVAHKLDEWLENGLQSWDISRDAPYFGFKIPDTDNKYFYVWLDAPIGYLASSKNLCDKQGLDFNSFWQADSTAEIYHFIGKDIVYFHTLFFPAMLHGGGFRAPSAVFAHGFLTVDGLKMSKSRGTFITARHYLKHLDPSYLRYYFAAKLGNGIDDIDLNVEDFGLRVNSDLVGKVVNIASRCAGFISKRFDGQLAAQLDDNTLYQQFIDAGDEIARAYENREYAKAMRQIMALADLANQYIDQQKPWIIAKQSGQEAQLQAVCSQGLNLFRILIGYLAPVLPTMVTDVETLFNTVVTWTPEALLSHKINPFKPLLQRIDPKALEALVNKPKPKKAPKKVKSSPKKTTAPEGVSYIDYDIFAKTQLTVAKIIKAQHVDGADKLLQLSLDIGETEHRNVFAGIKSSYPEPTALEGRLVIAVTNLAPRKMRFGISEGMVLAAGSPEQGLFLIQPDSGAKVGMSVK